MRSGPSRRPGSGRRPVGFACRDLEATNLLARQVEFFGDVFLLDFPASTSREDLSAELNLGVGNELPGLLLGFFEGGRSATDTGHRVGHLSIIAPQLRPTYQRPRTHKPQSRMPQSLWHRVVETTPDHQQQEPPLAVSKRLRSEIFRRDNSTCRYCGAKAPAVEITIDHVIPVTLGGSDEPSNLVTACADCNNGKTSVPPNAATVKQVSEDAFRWARAMEAAAEKTVGDRQAARTAFDQKWRAWSEGRPPIPRPEDWGLSIDRFLKAGLPLSVLLDCVDVAMSARQIKADAVFKYMCGAAWKEVKKLQQVARGLIDNSGTEEAEESFDVEESDLEKVNEEARHGLAYELLQKLTPWDRSTYFAQVLEAAAPYEPTTAELETTAICFAVEGVVTEREKLYEITMGFLHAAPGGKELWQRAVDELQAGDAPFTPGDVIEKATWWALNEGSEETEAEE